MEYKTQVQAEEGKHDIVITREFDLPVELLYKAYSDPKLLSQWMGTKVLKLEQKQHGGYQFETCDHEGNIVFTAHGTIHSVIPNKKIVRTFEMNSTGFEAQLEFLAFESLNEETSKLNMHIIYRSVADRDNQLKLPFAYGLNMAHDKLQEIAHHLKQQQ